jgi:hypothetical protein
MQFVSEEIGYHARSEEMMMKNAIRIVAAILLAIPLAAQQPQTNAPLYRVNAKYANGVAPGYWPTAGSGLTLNLSAGTANCSGSIVTYAGGTLTMAASTTNYVYLNSSCAPAVKNGGFGASDIPVATVNTGSSAISSITDDRTIFQTPGSGVGGGGTGQNGVILTASGAAVCGQFLREDATGATTITLPGTIVTGCGMVVERGVAAGVVTINPNGNSYDGVTTQLPQGEAIYIYTDGTGYHSNAPMVAGSGCTITPSLTGNSWTCSGGGFTAGGDLSGTSSSQQVGGILGHALPSLSSGYPHWNGSAWVFDTPSGGSGMPTATAPGQIPSSTAAGTTYAPQAQIFFNQTGDTISIIEGECSSPCTYIVTVPQTITLSASHAMNSNVHLQFDAGGKWTVNGAYTLSNVQIENSALTQHLAGSSTITFGPSVSLAPVEWFGAVGYPSMSATASGTDSTTPIQLDINALSVYGGQFLLQALGYRTTSALSIGASGVGGKGMSYGFQQQTGFTFVMNPSYILSTSASADILDVDGSSAPGSFILFNKFEDFSVQRSIAPTGTPAGLLLRHLAGFTVSRVSSGDSIYDFYLDYPQGYGTGSINYSTALNGQAGFTYTATTYGYYMSGHLFSLQMAYDMATTLNTTGTRYGFFLASGSAITDLMADWLETYQQTIGFVSQATLQDVHVNNMVNDSDYTCMSITSGSVGPGSGSFDSGWCYGQTAGAVITNMSGVSISRKQFYNQGIATTGSNNLNLSNDTIFHLATNQTAIALGTTTDSVVSGNTITGNGGTLVALTGSTYNALSGNNLNGTATTGLSLDSSSNHNTATVTNVIDPASITTPVSDSGTGNNISGTFAAAGDLSGSGSSQEVIGLLSHALPSLTSGYLHWNGSAYVFDTPGGSSPLTTKGDLFGYSTTGARIPVGIDGQVLTARSSNAAGVDYENPSGSYPTPETHVASSSAELDFTTCISSSYRNYVITFSDLVPASSANLLLQFSSDGGSTYDATSGHYIWTRTYAGLNTGGNSTSSNNSDIGVNIGSGVTGDSTYSNSGTVYLYNPSATRSKNIIANTVVDGGSSTMYWIGIGGLYTQTTALNAFRIIMASGNITSGEVSCQPLPQ